MKKYVAEFVGTLVLTLFGCGSAAISGALTERWEFSGSPWRLAFLSWPWHM